MAKMASLKKSGMTDFEVNMMGTSDLIQGLAQTYGERRIIDCCVDFLAETQGRQEKKLMETVFRVFGLDCIKRELSDYVKMGAIKPAAGANLLIACLP